MTHPAAVAEEPGTDLVPAASPMALALAPVMTDDEIQRTYRVAQALAASNIYKDVTRAEQSFAKLLIGRTLGINEQQAMSLYVMDGKVEVPYQLLGAFIRSRPGYDYRPAWIKQDGDARVAVWCDEDDMTDVREVVGAGVQFTVNGEQRGIWTFTKEDAERAQLLRPSSNHAKYPRNMSLARCMSSGIKAFIPEIASGMPIYAEGELPRESDRDLGAGQGDGSPPAGWGEVPIALADEVGKVIRRAQRLGHVGIGDYATAQMTLGHKDEAFVREWIQTRTTELDALQQAQAGLAAQQAEAAKAPPVPVHTTIERDGAMFCVVCGEQVDESRRTEPCPGGTLAREPEQAATAAQPAGSEAASAQSPPPSPALETSDDERTATTDAAVVDEATGEEGTTADPSAPGAPSEPVSSEFDERKSNLLERIDDAIANGDAAERAELEAELDALNAEGPQMGLM